VNPFSEREARQVVRDFEIVVGRGEEMREWKQMIERKTWKEFQDSKLLWWTNRLLHTFGWAIVLQVEANGEVTDVYPARVKFRGFGAREESEGFIGLTQYLKDTANELLQEAKE
jgi:hypothetical protein